MEYIIIKLWLELIRYIIIYSYETLQFLEHSSQTHRGSRTAPKLKMGVPMISWTETRDGGSMNETVLTACFLRWSMIDIMNIYIHTCIYISWIAQSWINYCIMSAYSFLPACFYRSMCINFLPTHLPKDYFLFRSQDGTSFSPGSLCILCILLFA